MLEDKKFSLLLKVDFSLDLIQIENDLPNSIFYKSPPSDKYRYS